MERSLVDLTVVSKYCPVANYSYPHKDSSSTTSNCYSNSRYSSDSSCGGRDSVGSEGSAPGLIEDRTDSEVSVDDDYQYHAHTAELWDSFWPHRASTRIKHAPFPVPSKQYPALMPSTRVKKQYACLGERAPPSWPLATASSAPSRTQTRKAAATYSPFPKPQSPPTTILASKEKKPQRSLTSCGTTPVRPPRPVEALLTPCIMQHTAFMPVSSAVADYIIQDFGPTAPTARRRLTTSCGQRPSKTSDEASPKRRSHYTIYSVISHSTTNLPVPEIRPSPTRAPRHFKSLAALPRVHVEQITQEPHSVFEDDSDCENGHTRKFFGFNKRSDSTYKRRMKRSNTTPAVAQKGAPKDDIPLPSTSAHQKRHGHDVFGRLLGRKSR